MVIKKMDKFNYYSWLSVCVSATFLFGIRSTFLSSARLLPAVFFRSELLRAHSIDKAAIHVAHKIKGKLLTSVALIL